MSDKKLRLEFDYGCRTVIVRDFTGTSEGGVGKEVKRISFEYLFKLSGIDFHKQTGTRETPSHTIRTIDEYTLKETQK